MNSSEFLVSFQKRIQRTLLWEQMGVTQLCGLLAVSFEKVEGFIQYILWYK